MSADLLSELRVLDFSTLLPGPYATRVLADYGAEIIRIEAPGRADMTREMAPLIDGVGALHRHLQRGKRSVCLDLKTAAGRSVVHELLKTTDVLVEGFRPGTMARLGLGYESLSEAHPSLIYASLTAYNEDGPLSSRAGHDLSVLARAGQLDAHTFPTFTQVADLGAALHLVTGILAAVVARSRTGAGQRVSVSMFDAAISLGVTGLTSALTGQPTDDTSRLDGVGLYDVYATRDGGAVAMAALEPVFLKRFCVAVGRADLLAVHSVPDLKAELTTLFRSKDTSWWATVLEPLDACVEVCVDLAHALAQAERLCVEVDGHRHVASPVRFNGRHPCAMQPAQARGADTRTVLQSVGVPEDAIEAMFAAGEARERGD
ncbi:MAG: CaiB/BaiF CoA transferase family protein [Myxococcota bacterium]